MTEHTTLVLVDPLNDFLDPKGKLYPMVKESIDSTNTTANIQELVKGARSAGIPIYYGLHQSFTEGHFQGWLHLRPSHHGIKQNQVFSGWGGEIIDGLEPQLSNGDVVVTRHWNSSSFVGTDLDYQLRQREITHLVMTGMVANTCLEATARDATEKGFKVTLLKMARQGSPINLKMRVSWFGLLFLRRSRRLRSGWEA